MRFSDPEFRRFLAAGVFNTVLGYLMYLAFTLVVDYRVAYTLSFVIGIFVAYAISTAYVFRKPWAWRRLVAFPSVYAIQYVLGLALTWLLVESFGLPKAFAPLFVVPFTIPITFLSSRFIIKGTPDEAKP